ncbi:hypothetical protein BIV57_13015 [Mangrovactinospora gilvigrisea]|uniref:ABC transporter domain-containing protein n=1 Tax=Mangrovactinospora gilvigrisea TaxID=1428644 RepID=A0A1J7BEF9_9ACTN|nr:ATP-binding cassette domain-containing protein [Mangrovactinospora gilvigrisea]OIV37079.1 hypothetical protein BIV57_13015 [Mangrovactinospora gilvigrisea]
MRVAPGATAVNLLWSVVTTAAQTGVLVATGRLVGALPDAVRHGWTARVTADLAVLVALFTVSQVVPVLWEHGRYHLKNVVKTAVSADVSDRMLAPAGVAHLEDPAVQDEYTRAAGFIGYTIRDGANQAQRMLQNRLSALAAAALIGVLFHWWLAVLALAALWATESYHARILYREDDTWHGESEHHRDAEYHFGLGMGPAAKELRVFGLGRWLTDRYDDRWTTASAPMNAVRRATAARGALVSTCGLAVFGAAIWFTAAAAADGALPLAATTSVVGALLRLATDVSGYVVSVTRRGSVCLRALRRLPGMIAERAPERGGTAALPDGAPHHEIRFEKVSFRYPGQRRDILRDLDLTIRAGEALALVGVNGAGKSTLVKLLTAAHLPTSGRILVDGVSLADLSPQARAAWQRRASTITQDFLRLPLSAAENVALREVGGDPADRAALDDAAERAGAADLVARLPHGWDTVLDKAHANGTDLSGGEWQRIALARALHATAHSSGVLILDEPAAALDVRAEAALVERYLELTSRVTSLIISHRFSVVRDADRIVVLEGGRVTEHGTHAQLLATDGKYATMFRTQADRYAA